jgi:hypothetical protein
MGRSSSVVDEEATLFSEEGAQRGIVDVKVDGASRDGGVCMNYRTHAAPPGDYQDDMHAEVGGGLACEQQVGSSLSIVYTIHICGMCSANQCRGNRLAAARPTRCLQRRMEAACCTTLKP